MVAKENCGVKPETICFKGGTCDQTWLSSESLTEGLSGQPDLSTTALQPVWESGDASLEEYVVDNRDDRCDQLKILDNIHRSWHYLDSSTCKCGNYSMGGGNFLCLRASLF